MLNQHRPQESLNKFAYVHWSLCLNVRCWLLWCTHQTFGAHQTFLLSVPAIEEWTHSWRSKLAQGSSDTCWNSSCFHQTFLSNKHPRPKHGIITPNNILDGKKTPCWPRKPSLLMNWTDTPQRPAPKEFYQPTWSSKSVKRRTNIFHPFCSLPAQSPRKYCPIQYPCKSETNFEQEQTRMLKCCGNFEKWKK